MGRTSPRLAVVLDGAMGTELARRGVSTPLPGWSAHAIDAAPDVVAAIHRDYAAAGASVHTANTFRTKRRNVGAQWERLARRAVRIARESVPASHRVAGSIAPLEDCYRPDSSPLLESRAEHRELARVLADERVDVLLCETFANVVEAAVAVDEAVRTGVETWVALTAGPGAPLITPERMRDAARAYVAAGAHAVLVNCTRASQTLAYVRTLADAGVSVGAYANADEWNASTDADEYASHAREWIEAGATIVGGCCGTSPAHIARVSALL